MTQFPLDIVKYKELNTVIARVDVLVAILDSEKDMKKRIIPAMIEGFTKSSIQGGRQEITDQVPVSPNAESSCMGAGAGALISYKVKYTRALSYCIIFHLPVIVRLHFYFHRAKCISGNFSNLISATRLSDCAYYVMTLFDIRMLP